MGLPIDLEPDPPAGSTLSILPRSDWGRDLPPLGEIVREDDVRFLLVHHSASSNEYGRDDVPGILQGFYAMHTGPEKGWPDIAYNFLVDRYGRIWEGRAGSLEGPVRGDATGGSQGFALLCCFVGDLTAAPPTPAAARSMAALLAWLGGEHDLDLSPGATTSFTSRGSNRWPPGTRVTTSTIAAHRDMSLTSCPGDAGYAFVRADLPVLVGDAAATSAAAAPARALEPQRNPRRGNTRRRKKLREAATAASEPAGWPLWQKVGLVTTVVAVVGRFLTQPARDADDTWHRRPPAPSGAERRRSGG